MRIKKDRTEPCVFMATKEEKEAILALADEHDATFSNYARKVLLGKIPNAYGKQEQEETSPKVD